jgi:nucleotide-binding universal stress UspA family protein
MRVLVSVDQVEGAREVSGWVEKLGFKEKTEEWVHIVPSQKGTVWALDPFLAVGESERLQEQAAQKMEQLLKEQSGSASVRVRIGNPATELLNRADETRTDILAARGSNKSGLQAFLLGSVARALVEGASQSVLLTRGPAPQAPLRVVVATDHSEYMEKALALLVGWAPQGIGQLTLLHVLPPALKADMNQLAQEIAHETYGRPIRTPEEVTMAAAKALGASLGIAADAVNSRVAQGSVSEAIEAVLEETGADLLVLGAKGHTLLERLALGSVSFRAVTTCPKSLLVLRA